MIPIEKEAEKRRNRSPLLRYLKLIALLQPQAKNVINNLLACYQQKSTIPHLLTAVENQLYTKINMHKQISLLASKVAALQELLPQIPEEHYKIAAYVYELLIDSYLLGSSENKEYARTTLLPTIKSIANYYNDNSNVKNYFLMIYYNCVAKCQPMSIDNFSSANMFEELVQAGQAEYGDIEPNAIFLDQHEVGFSSNKPLGTHNIQTCIVLIVRDPGTHLTALAHIDANIDSESVKRVFSNFDASHSLEIHLIGASGTKFKNNEWKLPNLLLEGNEPLPLKEIEEEIGNCIASIAGTGKGDDSDYQALKNIYTVIYAMLTSEHTFTFKNVVVAGRHEPSIVVNPATGELKACTPAFDLTKCTAGCFVGYYKNHTQLFTALENGEENRKYHITLSGQQVSTLWNKYQEYQNTHNGDYATAIKSDLFKSVQEAGIVRVAIIAQSQITCMQVFIEAIEYVSASCQMDKAQVIQLLLHSDLSLCVGDNYQEMNQGLITQLTQLQNTESSVEQPLAISTTPSAPPLTST